MKKTFDVFSILPVFAILMSKIRAKKYKNSKSNMVIKRGLCTFTRVPPTLAQKKISGRVHRMPEQIFSVKIIFSVKRDNGGRR